MPEIKGLEIVLPEKQQEVPISKEEQMEMFRKFREMEIQKRKEAGEDVSGEDPDKMPDFMMGPPPGKPAVVIKNGSPAEEEMRKQYIYGGEIGERSAKGVKICTYDGDVGGVFATGSGSYEVDGLTVSKQGHSMGLGAERAGACAHDHAVLTIRNANIYAWGDKNMCTSAEDGGILRVYDSHLVAMGAPYGDDAPESDYEVKDSADIGGNTRAHCTQRNGRTYFHNCTISTDGWGAMSTDAGDEYVWLEADNCRVTTTKAGYGTFADGHCHSAFHNCDFDVASMGCVINNGESDITFKDCKLKCGTWFCMMNSAFGNKCRTSGLTAIGCDVSSKDDAVYVKSHNVDITFDHSNIHSDKMVLVHTVISDDIHSVRTQGEEGIYGVRVYLKNGVYIGDILHEDTDRECYVMVDGNSTICGVLENVNLFLEEGAKWIAVRDSHVTLAGSVNTESIDADAGVTVYAVGAEAGEYPLASGGRLVVTAGA